MIWVTGSPPLSFIGTFGRSEGLHRVIGRFCPQAAPSQPTQNPDLGPFDTPGRTHYVGAKDMKSP